MHQKKEDTLQELNNMIKLKKSYIENRSFLIDLEKYSKNKLKEYEIVRITKRKYLYENRTEIKKAIEYGYSYMIIAQFATEALLKYDIPKNYKIIKKDKRVIEKKSIFSASEIKKFLENN